MGIYKGNLEISPKIGLTEIDGVYLGDKEIWKNFVPFAQDFIYKGSIEEFVVPYNGLYMLEVWGGQGGIGAKGGYSLGYIVLDKGQKIFVCVGGGGISKSGNVGTIAGGYNGGGNALTNIYLSSTTGSGGGATHIAKVSGELASIGYASFVTNGNGLIVAGGGAGSNTGGSATTGGTGGGLTGGKGSGSNGGGGGTQTAGGTSERVAGSFGKGAVPNYGTCGAGGGLFGGGAGFGSGAGGGSGYIGGVPTIDFKGTTYSPTTSNGVNSGNGKAKITRIA